MLEKKTDKLPPIRISPSQKEKLYKMAEKNDMKVSQFVINSIFRPDIIENGATDVLENMIDKLNSQKCCTKNAMEKFRISNKIDLIKEILEDVKKID